MAHKILAKMLHKTNITPPIVGVFDFILCVGIKSDIGCEAFFCFAHCINFGNKNIEKQNEIMNAKPARNDIYWNMFIPSSEYR